MGKSMEPTAIEKEKAVNIKRIMEKQIIYQQLLDLFTD